MRVRSENSFDVVILGGGLSGTLIACRLKDVRPELSVLVLERGSTLGGNHTWSFHETDVTGLQADWLAPFVVHSWGTQRVKFPQLDRTIVSGYRTITSARIHEIGMARLGGAALTHADVATVQDGQVQLTDGRSFSARCMIDCRGACLDDTLIVGYQKFVGHEIFTRRPHLVRHPLLMDADLPQIDGYRFVYVLPLDPDRLLIEDTSYSDGSALDVDQLGSRIDAYAAAQGWETEAVIRHEAGVLPITLGGDIEAFWRNRRAQTPCACAGMRAALFHPTTGYSLPDAVALADQLVGVADLETRSVSGFVEQYSCRLWQERSFFRMLNRFMFLAAVPDQRWRIMQRFYGLDLGLVERFYAARLTPLDKARILVGIPPVSLHRAIRAIPEAAAKNWPKCLSGTTPSRPRAS